MTTTRPPASAAAPAVEPDSFPGWLTGVLIDSIMLTALGLRLIGIGELQVWGDGAYSVYLATLDLPSLLAHTAVDSHPPLYYLLLQRWLAIAGWTEISVRYLSVCAGVLAVALTFTLGRRLFNARVGLAAALWVAVSPFAVSFSRLPRMYAQMLCLSLLLMLLVEHAGRGKGERWLNPAIGVTAALLLYTHYYGLLPVAAATLYLLLTPGRKPSSLAARIARLWPVLAAGVAILPWLVFALGPSLAHTARTIANQPAPVGLPAFWLITWVGLHAGQLMPVKLALGATVAFGVFMVAGTIAALVRPPGEHSVATRARAAPGGWRFLAIWLLVPLVLASLVFVFFPQFGRIRFLLWLLPVYCILVAALVVRRPVLGAAIVGLGAVVLAASGVLTLQNEARVWESDARDLATVLQDQASDADAVVLQASWQIGYLRLHGPQPPPAYFGLEDVDKSDMEQILASHRLTWLGMYQTSAHDPAYPLESALDRAAARAESQELGPTRLTAYAAPIVPGAAPEVEFDGLFKLVGQSARPLDAVPGGAIVVTANWTATRQPDANYASFVHLVDLQGQGWAGRDAEPGDGQLPTSGWAVGMTRVENYLLSLPPTLPPGTYRLQAGWHATGSSEALPAQGKTFVDLGSVQIRAKKAPEGPARVVFGDRIGLDTVAVSRDSGERIQRESILTTDGPLVLSTLDGSYRRGEVLRIRLAWRSLAATPVDYTVFVHLARTDGRPAAQADGPPAEGRFTTSYWQAGDKILDEHLLVLPQDLTPGDYRLLAGLYSQPDLKRLVARGPWAAGVDAADLGVIRVAATASAASAP